MDITSFILGYKKGIASGGDTTHPVHTVTFMSEDGETVLYQRSVVDGDNCADVVSRGLLATPKKESSAQYNYTYSGWSSTSGGAASTSALSAVTEDRTVYAAYTSEVRYYTITYYDGDTVLKTESKAYGSTLSYTPEKDGYSFIEWSPALATVTGDANYYAQWEEKVTFTGGSWTDIAAISEAGEAEQYFKVGDTRQITLSSGGTITVAIAGFNHDTLADGSGRTAGISIVCMTVPQLTVQWSNNTSGTTFFPYAYTGSGTYTQNSTLRTYLTETLFGYLPSELQDIIKPVLKKCDGTNSSGTSPNLYETSETLWALSLDEMGHNETGTTNISTLGSRYELFTSGNITSNMLPILESVTIADTGNIANKYWTRHIRRTGTPQTYRISHTDYYGNIGKGWAENGDGSKNDIWNTKCYIRFGFCI